MLQQVEAPTAIDVQISNGRTAVMGGVTFGKHTKVRCGFHTVVTGWMPRCCG